MRNALDNSGDGALTMVPLCRELSGTGDHTRKTMEVKRTSWQTMDVTGSLIYYLYLPDDSSSSHLI